MFENRMVRKIFGRKRDEVTGNLWRLYTKELYNMYSSPDITGASQIGPCCTELDIERVIERHHIHSEYNDGYDILKYEINLRFTALYFVFCFSSIPRTRFVISSLALR